MCQLSLVKISAKKINPTPALYPSSKNTNSEEWDNITFTAPKSSMNLIRSYKVRKHLLTKSRKMVDVIRMICTNNSNI